MLVTRPPPSDPYGARHSVMYFPAGPTTETTALESAGRYLTEAATFKISLAGTSPTTTIDLPSTIPVHSSA